MCGIGKSIGREQGSGCQGPRGGGAGEGLLMGSAFPSGVMRSSGIKTVVMGTQPCE